MADFNVKIVRLISGEEIIANFHQTKATINLKDPCVLVPTQEGKLMFVRWVPYAQTKDGIEINERNIVFIVEAVPELAEHFKNVVVNNLFVPGPKRLTTPNSGPMGSNPSLSLTP
jgi:hypothetical protein